MLVKSPEDGDLKFVVFNDGDDDDNDDDDNDDDDALQRHLPTYIQVPIQVWNTVYR